MDLHSALATRAGYCRIVITPDDVERIFRNANAFRDGHFVLASGKHSPRYLEKFQVLQWPQETERLCGTIAAWWRAAVPDTVAGPTTGGPDAVAVEVGDCCQTSDQGHAARSAAWWPGSCTRNRRTPGRWADADVLVAIDPFAAVRSAL